MQRLNDLIEQKMRGLKERIDLRRIRGLEAATQASLEGHGLEIMDEIRLEIRQLRTADPVDFEQFRNVVKQLGLFWLVVNQVPPASAFKSS